MKHTEKEVIKIIKEVVHEVTGIRTAADEENLLSTELDILPADFLYIFDLLEKKLGVPAVDVLKETDYQVMRIDYLSKALLELMHCLS